MFESSIGGNYFRHHKFCRKHWFSSKVDTDQLLRGSKNTRELEKTSELEHGSTCTPPREYFHGPTQEFRSTQRSWGDRTVVQCKNPPPFPSLWETGNVLPSGGNVKGLDWEPLVYLHSLSTRGGGERGGGERRGRERRAKAQGMEDESSCHE